MSRRMVMLGLDALDWVLVNEWAAAGRLPTFRALLGESRALILGESNRPLPGSVWTDIATGVSAAVHGYVDTHQLRFGSYETETVDASCVAAAPFYKILSDAGVRCAVVDFPVDCPLPRFNGIQVVDWGSEFKLWSFETQPKRLAGRLVAQYGRHPLTDYTRTRTGLPDLLALKHKLQRGIGIKQRFASDLLDRREHDFIYVNFAELHKAGHFFWRFHDRSHPEFTDAEPQLVDSLRSLYEDMDEALGCVLQHLRGGDDLIVVTDRGMYPEYRGDHLVDEVLLRLELATPLGKAAAKTRTESLRARWLSGRRARQAYSQLSRRLPDGLRAILRPLHRAAIGAPAPLDWKRTRVFRMPTVGNTYLRVNLAGREPWGNVSPGAQYDALLAQIATRFRALINPETEETAVEDIYFPARQFPGPKALALPDVAVVWKPAAPINALIAADMGMVQGLQQSDRSGNHRPEGFALFRSGSLAAGVGTHEGDARQVAPAVLAHFGVAPPAHYERQAPEFLTARHSRAA